MRLVLACFPIVGLVLLTRGVSGLNSQQPHGNPYQTSVAVPDHGLDEFVVTRRIKGKIRNTNEASIQKRSVLPSKTRGAVDRKLDEIVFSLVEGKKDKKDKKEKGKKKKEKKSPRLETNMPTDTGGATTWYPQATTMPPTYKGTIPPPRIPPMNANFTTRLDLSNVPTRYKTAFRLAAKRWESVIVGALPNAPITPTMRTQSHCSNLPVVINDVFICVTVDYIDGPSNVLGFAGPEYVRENGLPLTGYMTFDSDDVAQLADNGKLNGVILHEMGHVYGIGNLWKARNLTLPRSGGECPYSYTSSASAEFRALSGCNASVPIETSGGKGTVCAHWSEECLQSELMTGYATGGMELSRITVGGLQDLGYTVDFSRADPFPTSQLNPSCVCASTAPATTTVTTAAAATAAVSYKLENGQKLPVAQAHVRSSHFQRLTLSERGRQVAISFGEEILRNRKSATIDPMMLMDNQTANVEGDSEETQKYTYLGDRYVTVLYKENGQIFSVKVALD